MMPKKILHIASCDKFIPPFIEFVKENFDFDEHRFLLTNGMSEKFLIDSQNIELSGKTKYLKLKHYFKVLTKMHEADKIILHSLFDMRVVQILFFTPWLLKKCYWVIWGGDLYAYKLSSRNIKWYIKEFFRRPVIKHMGHIVCYTKGELLLARKWYATKAKYIKCFCYTSNLFIPNKPIEKNSSSINILVGNSADPTNNHIEVLEYLKQFKIQNINIYTPLTYGNKIYAKSVINKGIEIFGDKYYPLTEHMKKEEYINFLSSIDIAIFHHDRQQAMGNIRTLLGMGKKVYMKKNLTSTQTLHEDGIKTFELKEFDLDPSFKESEDNVQLISIIFSVENLKSGLQTVFNK